MDQIPGRTQRHTADPSTRDEAADPAGRQGSAPPTLEFIGTATTVLRLGPFTVLTDPNFLRRGQRAYLGNGLFSRRRTDPSCRPADLPALDAVVLSHLHGDHFDRVARRELDRSPPVLTTPAATRRLRSWGFAAEPMSTWDTCTLHRDRATLEVTATPGQHAPGLARALLPPVMGSVLTLRQPDRRDLRVYVTGDTLYRPWLGQVAERCGPLDAMVIHLGGTRALGLLVTMDADQGADLVELIRPPVTVPVHYDDYSVFRSPLRDFVDRWRERDLPGQLHVVGRGERVRLDPVP